jgi:hypothetical protein
MSLSVKQQGEYRLYETRDRRRKLLFLSGVAYEWLTAVREDMLMISSAQPAEDSLIGQGQYLLLWPYQEPGWEDGVDYLALSNSKDYFHLYKLPNGLPTDRSQQRPILSLPRIVSSATFKEKGLSWLI